MHTSPSSKMNNYEYCYILWYYSFLLRSKSRFHSLNRFFLRQLFIFIIILLNVFVVIIFKLVLLFDMNIQIVLQGIRNYFIVNQLADIERVLQLDLYYFLLILRQFFVLFSFDVDIPKDIKNRFLFHFLSFHFLIFLLLDNFLCNILSVLPVQSSALDF